MLYVIGELALSRAGRLATGPALGTRKARTLLAFLAVAGGRPVPATALADVLWEGARPARPEENISTLISRLRGRLGADLVSGGRTGYRLAERLSVDLHEAAAHVAAAEAGPPEASGRAPGRQGAAAHAGRALELLDRGRVLDGLTDAAWVEPARRAHEALLRRARHAAARSALGLGRWVEAQAASAAAVAADPYDEAACRLLMQAHHGAGEPARALLAYQRLRAALADDLGIDPAPATQRLHVAVLRGGPSLREGAPNPGMRRPGMAVLHADREVRRVAGRP